MKHPQFSEILDYFENRLSSSAKKRVQTHLDSGCSSCQSDVEWLSRNLGLMKSESVLYDAPENLVQKAIDVFPEKKHTVRDWVKARLQFDSWKVPQTAGVRSGGQGPRQWIYSSDSYKIHLMLDETTEGQQIIGQLVSDNPETDIAGCLIELTRNDKQLEWVCTNQNGEFLLSSVPTQFELKIHGSPESILLRHHLN